MEIEGHNNIFEIFHWKIPGRFQIFRANIPEIFRKYFMLCGTHTLILI